MMIGNTYKSSAIFVTNLFRRSARAQTLLDRLVCVPGPLETCGNIGGRWCNTPGPPEAIAAACSTSRQGGAQDLLCQDLMRSAGGNFENLKFSRSATRVHVVLDSAPPRLEVEQAAEMASGGPETSPDVPTCPQCPSDAYQSIQKGLGPRRPPKSVCNKKDTTF